MLYIIAILVTAITLSAAAADISHRGILPGLIAPFDLDVSITVRTVNECAQLCQDSNCVAFQIAIAREPIHHLSCQILLLSHLQSISSSLEGDRSRRNGKRAVRPSIWLRGEAEILRLELLPSLQVVGSNPNIQSAQSIVMSEKWEIVPSYEVEAEQARVNEKARRAKRTGSKEDPIKDEQPKASQEDSPVKPIEPKLEVEDAVMHPAETEKLKLGDLSSQGKILRMRSHRPAGDHLVPLLDLNSPQRRKGSSFCGSFSVKREDSLELAKIRMRQCHERKDCDLDLGNYSCKASENIPTEPEETTLIEAQILVESTRVDEVEKDLLVTSSHVANSFDESGAETPEEVAPENEDNVTIAVACASTAVVLVAGGVGTILARGYRRDESQVIDPSLSGFNLRLPRGLTSKNRQRSDLSSSISTVSRDTIMSPRIGIKNRNTGLSQQMTMIEAKALLDDAMRQDMQSAFPHDMDPGAFTSTAMRPATTGLRVDTKSLSDEF